MENCNFMMDYDRNNHSIIAYDRKSSLYDGVSWEIVILRWGMIEKRHFMVADDENLTFYDGR